VKRFRGGLVFKAHRLLYHLTLSWRVIKKKKKLGCVHPHAVLSEVERLVLRARVPPAMPNQFVRGRSSKEFQ